MADIYQLIGSIQDKQNISQGVQNAQTESIGNIDDTIAPLLLIQPGSTDSTQFLNLDGTFKAIQTASVNAAGIIRLIDENDMSSDLDTRVPTQQSVKAYVTTQINSLIAGAPSTLNDLNELAAALNDNPDIHQLVTANQTKLANIEAYADVTDTANVTAAGALMDSELTDLNGVKTVTISTLQVKPSEGAFVNGDKTKLNGIEAGATADQTAADIKTLLAASKLETAHIADNSITTTQLAPTSVTANSYGSASAIPIITVDAKGRITAASTASVTAGGGTIISGSSIKSDLTNTNVNTTSSISLGVNAGNSGQGSQTIAIGLNAASTSQGNNGIAIGIDAGKTSQGIRAIAIGESAAMNTGQGASAVAIGHTAGRDDQQDYAVAIGSACGTQQSQGIAAVAIGNVAGHINQGNYAIAIGNSVAYTGQGTNGIALGTNAGETDQGASAVAIGTGSGRYNSQGSNAVAIGNIAGHNNQGNTSIAIGNSAASLNQGELSIAIGSDAGTDNQDTRSIAIGYNAGKYDQGSYAIAIGDNAGEGNDGTGQATYAVAIGTNAGEVNQGESGIAIGRGAGNTSQVHHAIAIGKEAGNSSQSVQAVALGQEAGKTSQGDRGVAIGLYAGKTSQGNYAVGIGYQAGYQSQHANSIVLNASGSALNSDGASRFFVKPIRTDYNHQIDNNVTYNPTSGEIKHNTKVVFSARANSATLTSHTNVSSWTIDLDTASNGAANSGDVYTIPRNGIYMVTVSAYVRTVQTNSGYSLVSLHMVRGGSESLLFEQVHEEANPATIKKRPCNIAGIWQYNINDIIRIKVNADNIGFSPHVTIDSNFRLAILSID